MQTRLQPSQKFYAQPFLKWAGGKRQLLKEIRNNLPDNVKDNDIDTIYFEPFIGGGSVFFDLKNNYNLGTSIISDINPELMLTYKCIQKKPEHLKKRLKKMKKEYSKKKTLEDKKDYYYNEIRASFNDNLSEINLNKLGKKCVERAAQMIFMNKTCFNGLFRVNKEGKFNVPMGRYENPKIYDPDNIDEVNRVLNDNVYIIVQDYLNTEKYIEKIPSNEIFVYLDPPYRPLNKNSFTEYYKDGFTEEDQINLSQYIERLTEKKVNVMLSNSKVEDDFYKKYYNNQKFHPVKARRNINSNGKKRKKIDELIITNY